MKSWGNISTPPRRAGAQAVQNVGKKLKSLKGPNAGPLTNIVVVRIQNSLAL